MNDGDDATLCHVEFQGIGEFIELDFGEGGKKVNRIRVIHRPSYYYYAVGVTLYALDNHRRVLFKHTWTTPPVGEENFSVNQQ